MSSLAGLRFASLVTAEQLRELPPFEQRIWGGDGVLVSVNMLVATISEGGMAIGVFDGEQLVGAVYGFATNDPRVLHSHYLAVDPAWRRYGLGVELKHRQRAWCLERGINRIRWTYDPLQIGNAHLNLRVLAARGVSYHVDHYGTLGGINGELASDRVTVSWALSALGERPAPTLAIDVPQLTTDDIATSSAAAIAAREFVRDELRDRLGNGWQLVDVDRDGRRYFLAPT